MEIERNEIQAPTLESNPEPKTEEKKPQNRKPKAKPITIKQVLAFVQKAKIKDCLAIQEAVLKRIKPTKSTTKVKRYKLRFSLNGKDYELEETAAGLARKVAEIVYGMEISNPALVYTGRPTANFRTKANMDKVIALLTEHDAEILEYPAI